MFLQMTSNVGMHGQLLVAADVEVSDCVQLQLGALQRLDHESHIPALSVTACKAFPLKTNSQQLVPQLTITHVH